MLLGRCPMVRGGLWYLDFRTNKGFRAPLTVPHGPPVVSTLDGKLTPPCALNVGAR